MFRELRAQISAARLGSSVHIRGFCHIQPVLVKLQPKHGVNKSDVFPYFPFLLLIRRSVPATGRTFSISLLETLNRVLLSHFSDSIM